MARQPNLFLETFATAEAAAPVYCHQEFLAKIKDNERNAVGRRAALLLERLAVDARREFYKGTMGVNRGWRRSRLGGSGGSHFYAWWAPRGAPPLSDGGFDSAAEGAFFLRDIRHHDDHAELRAQTLADYLQIPVKDLKGLEFAPSPLTTVQAQFTSSPGNARVIKGYPGSGKTTALWHAAEENCARSALYVTYSSELAAMAKNYFQRFAPADKQFLVVTWSQFLRRATGSTAPAVPLAESRTRFTKLLGALPPRVLGPWADDRGALYDEVYAHMFGWALPFAAGRFEACERPRLADRAYREQRRRALGNTAVDSAIDAVNTLERKHGDALYQDCFPELQLARAAAVALAAKEYTRKSLVACDCLAVDEVQDLTPVEAFAVIKLAARIEKDSDARPRLLLAGDEAQTVRPTDFEWGWLNDLLHQGFETPKEFELPANLRSPRRIARVTSAVWELYSSIAKNERPAGQREAEIEDEASDQVLYCSASRDAALESLLRALADREGLGIVTLGEKVPSYVPEDIAGRILTVAEAKGLDFRDVCVLDAGPCLDRIVENSDKLRRDSAILPLAKRLAIDQLRVAVSRPTDRLYFLDVQPAPSHLRRMREFLHFALDADVSPVPAEVALQTLGEEALTLEERVQLCERDAIQFLDVRPEMAFARAKQAASLAQGADPELRKRAARTFFRVAATLCLRGAALPPELGVADIRAEAETSADLAGSDLLRDAMHALALFREAPLFAVLDAFEKAHAAEALLEPWFGAELARAHPDWLAKLEAAASEMGTARRAVDVAPFAYKLYDVSDPAERVERLRKDAIAALMQVQFYKEALDLLEMEPEPPADQVAECREGLGEYAAAAEMYLKIGKPKDALRCFRGIPDIDRSLEVMREIGGQSAEESLLWARDLREILERRPKNFARVATDAEKKWLTELLEAQIVRPPRKGGPAFGLRLPKS